MAYSVLHDSLYRKSFRPLDLSISDGRTFSIQHPENFLLTKNTLVIKTISDDEEHLHHMSLLQIVSADSVDVPSDAA